MRKLWNSFVRKDLLLPMHRKWLCLASNKCRNRVSVTYVSLLFQSYAIHYGHVFDKAQLCFLGYAFQFATKREPVKSLFGHFSTPLV